MTTVGFIGLGLMGAPMVRNLLRAGYSLVIYNRSVEKTAEFQGHERARIAESPAETARSSDVLITMLADHAAIEDVYFGERGIISGLETSGSHCGIVIDSSTVAPAMSLRLAGSLAERGVEFLDAPVLGSKPQAIEGALTFMVGGRRETFERWRDLLLAMGKKALHMGENGAGSRAKLANNTLAAINLVGAAESLRIIQEAGIDPDLFLDAVSGGLARSAMLHGKGPAMLAGDFSPHFTIRLMLKDLGLAEEMTASLGLNTPMLRAALERMRAASQAGFGEEDVGAVFKTYRKNT